MPCDSRKNRRFGERIASIIRVTRIGELGSTVAVTSNRSTLRSLIPEDGILLLVMLVCQLTALFYRECRRMTSDDWKVSGRRLSWHNPGIILTFPCSSATKYLSPCRKCSGWNPHGASLEYKASEVPLYQSVLTLRICMEETSTLSPDRDTRSTYRIFSWFS
jgi:hypothetical protein